MDVIEAGIFDKFKSISNSVKKHLSKLVDYGIKLGEAKQNDNNVYELSGKLADGTRIKVMWKPMDSAGSKYKLLVKDEYDKEAKRDNVLESEYDDVLKQLLEENWKSSIKISKDDHDSEGNSVDTSNVDDSNDINDENSNSVNECRKISVKLKRVCGSSEDTIQLMSIYGNYDISSMSADLDVFLDTPDVVCQITEEPVSFEILDEGSSLQVNPVEINESECINGSLITMLKASYKCMHNLQAIHWNAKGEMFREIHEHTNNLIWSCRSYIDMLSELCVELTGSVAHPCNFIECDCIQEYKTSKGFSGVNALLEIKNCLSDLSNTFTFYVCNFPDDVQHEIYIWIRDLNRLAEYHMNRSIMT